MVFRRVNQMTHDGEPGAEVFMEQNKRTEKLSFVFVHGTAGWGSYDERYQKMPYWGMRGGDLMTYLRERGYDCHAASVSPSGSAWDRACELYAQIFGTRVDYGRCHSRTYGHERFGRDYSFRPLIPDLSEETRLVLIGHSFGGTAARMFAELLAHGDEAERAANEEDISPLFLGGRQERIHSVVCIAAAMNGNSTFDMTSDPEFDPDAVPVPFWTRLFEKRMAKALAKENAGINPQDSADYDMQIDHARSLNQRMKALPFVFYFSVPCCYTVKQGDGFVPEKGMEPFFLMRSYQLGQYTGTTKGGMRIDRQWLRNDGRVNTISETAPIGEKSRMLDRDHIEKGIWNIFPVYHGDHMSLQGGMLHKNDIRGFYQDLLELISSL